MATVNVPAAYSRSSNSIGGGQEELACARGGDGNGYRWAARYDLFSYLATDATINSVQFTSKVDFLVGSPAAESIYVGPYAGDGSGDPQVDPDSTIFGRCEVSSDNYGLFTDFRTVGTKTITLGSPAAADIQARVSVGASFSLALRQTPTEAGISGAGIGSVWKDYLDGADAPTLVIDYTAAAAAASDESEFEFQEIEDLNQTELSIWNRALSYCGDLRLTFGSAKTVSSATAAIPVVCTSAAHGFSNGDLVVHTLFDQMTEINARVFRVENVATNTYELADEDGTAYAAETSGGVARKLTASSNKQAKALFDAWPNLRDEVLRDHPWNCTMAYARLARLQTAKTITGATAANPVVITSAAHGYTAGDMVFIDRVLGMTELNNRWFTVGTVPSSSTYQLSGINGLLYTAYSSAGRSQKALTPFTPDFDYAYKYTLPTDCLDLVELANLSRDDWEVVEDRTVYTDAGITVPIRYVRRNRDTTKYDPLLRTLLAKRLAYEIVAELVESNSKKELLRKDWEDAERKAKVRDAQEHSVSELAPDEWELARL